MKEIKSSVDIGAPIERVWGTVTDFNSYPEWNPFIVSMPGEAKVGSTLKVRTAVAGRGETNFTSKIVELEPNKRILMQGTIKKGMLTDDHLFTFESLGPQKTRFFQSVAFKGFLTSFVGGTIKDSQKGLEGMNLALKARCEATGKS